MHKRKEKVKYLNLQHYGNNADTTSNRLCIWSKLILFTKQDQKVIYTDTSEVINMVGYIANIFYRFHEWRNLTTSELLSHTSEYMKLTHD